MKVRKKSAAGLIAVVAVLASWSEAIAEKVLVPHGARTLWRYLDDGSDPGTAWRTPDFDDTAWIVGPAPLGYGDPGIETQVSFGPDPKHKHITTYFRHHFEINAIDGCEQLVFRIRSDDGVQVSINGEEVIRNNLPAGGLGSETTAIEALNDLDERLWRHFRVPGKLLAPGKNVLAVAVRQAEALSSDLFLDLELRGYGDAEEPRPLAAIEARPQIRAFLQQHRIPQGQPVVDGYMDGGRAATINSAGLVSSGREVIVVDRSRDELLRRHLEFARSEPLKALAPLDRAAVLAVYVDRVMAHVGGRRFCEPADTLLVTEYRGEPVLLAEVPQLCGSGVCRHRSLLFKLMGDEAGLQVALVRGGLNTGQAIGEHAWNELFLEDGQRLIVDTLALPESPFPDVHADAAGRYVDVGNTPLYREGPIQPVRPGQE